MWIFTLWIDSETIIICTQFKLILCRCIYTVTYSNHASPSFFLSLTLFVLFVTGFFIRNSSLSYSSLSLSPAPAPSLHRYFTLLLLLLVLCMLRTLSAHKNHFKWSTILCTDAWCSISEKYVCITIIEWNAGSNSVYRHNERERERTEQRAHMCACW